VIWPKQYEAGRRQLEVNFQRAAQTAPEAK